MVLLPSQGCWDLMSWSYKVLRACSAGHLVSAQESWDAAITLVLLSSGADEGDTEAQEDTGAEMGQQETARSSWLGSSFPWKSPFQPPPQAAEMVLLGSKNAPFSLCTTFHKEFLCLRGPGDLWSHLHAFEALSPGSKIKSLTSHNSFKRCFLSVSVSWLRDTHFLKRTETKRGGGGGSSPCVSAHPPSPDPFPALLALFFAPGG